MLKLVHHSDPILSRPSERVDVVSDEVKTLAWKMISMLPDTGGIGLSACQVGHPIQLFVVDIWWPNTGNTDNALVFINPKLTWLSPSTERRGEGCLSFPGVHESIPRAVTVQVNAEDIGGFSFENTYSHLLARVIQHEYDHLQGVTFLSRMGTLAKRLAKAKLRKV